MVTRHPLRERLAELSGGRGGDEDALLEQFLSYVSGLNLTLYPAQEEAILELFSGKHVILATPTGSGKSLVAFAMVLRTLSQGGRAFYTCPIKALVNEKFFQLVDVFGPENVGMMTGDATINEEAPIICCTAEIASSMALRRGLASPIDGIIMDEFHYYSDKERGIAWQIPLLILSRTHFLLMSATLGDATPFVARLKALTRREAVLIENATRPVPLDYTYAEEPLLETIKTLTSTGRSPIYIVCFTQRAAAEQAQDLMSENYTTKEEKRAILEALVDFKFDTAYGKDVQRFLKQGIGLHHAGLLPKYRLLVEQLAQTGLLKVICGTDTLGVGVNIPIRTVLFTKLCKFDGEKVVILPVREFQQIAGRAGRKGFDDRGSVVVQAPEHVIENIKIDRKKDADPKKHKNLQRAKPPQKGYVPWDASTFERLTTGKPEPLIPRFNVTHGMLIDLLDNPETGRAGGTGELFALVAKSHIPDREKRRQRLLVPQIFRSLRHAGLIELGPRPSGKRGKLALISPKLQRDFSLMHALSLWLIDFLPILHETRTESYALDVLSAVEAILENPKIVLEKQVDLLKTEKLNELKAAGVEYEERMAELEKVEYPKPNADVIYATFDTFSKHHPWATLENIRPKSVARDLVERNATFNEYVREYDLARAEGVLLRYLSEVVKTLDHTVPTAWKTHEVIDALEFLRLTVREVDSALLDEWEGKFGDPTKVKTSEVIVAPDEDDPRKVLVRVRRDLHRLVQHLATRSWSAAAALLKNPEEWPAARLEETLKPFFERHPMVFQHDARKAEHTSLEGKGPRAWEAIQTLLEPEGPSDFVLVCDVVLETGDLAGPAVLILRELRES